MRRLVALLPVLVAFQVGASPAHAWTWPVDGPVLQPFTLGDDPYAGGQHRGLDVGAAAGAPVVAPASGTVTFAGFVPVSGRTVSLTTPDGYAVTLVHLGSTAVTAGATVAEGEAVGTIGPTGTPEHAEPYVHLGVRVASDPQGYLDPLSLLPARGAAAPPPPADPPAEEPPDVPPAEPAVEAEPASPDTGATEPLPAAGGGGQDAASEPPAATAPAAAAAEAPPPPDVPVPEEPAPAIPAPVAPPIEAGHAGEVPEAAPEPRPAEPAPPPAVVTPAAEPTAATSGAGMATAAGAPAEEPPVGAAPSAPVASASRAKAHAAGVARRRRSEEARPRGTAERPFRRRPGAAEQDAPAPAVTTSPAVFLDHLPPPAPVALASTAGADGRGTALVLTLMGVLLGATALAVAAIAGGRRLVDRREVGDAGPADRPAPVLGEVVTGAAEDAARERAREEDRLVLDRDLERIFLTQAEPLANFNRDHDPTQFVDVPHDPRPNHPPSPSRAARRLPFPQRPRSRLPRRHR